MNEGHAEDREREQRHLYARLMTPCCATDGEGGRYSQGEGGFETPLVTLLDGRRSNFVDGSRWRFIKNEGNDENSEVDQYFRLSFNLSERLHVLPLRVRVDAAG